MFKAAVVLAIIIRLLLMPISTHSDLFFINSFPNLLVSEKVVNVNDYIKNNIKEENFSFYPPLTYYTFAFFQFFYQFFSSTFSPWMRDVRLLYAEDFRGQAANYIKATHNPNLQRDLFLAKTPYLLFEIGVLMVLWNFYKKRLINKYTLILWLFNPILIYAIYIFGQFEIIPTFFILLGFLILKKNPKLGLFTLGIAAAYKNYAFIFVLPTAIVYGSTQARRAKLLAISLLPYLIALLPVLLSTPDQIIYAFLPKVFLQSPDVLERWALYSQSIKYAMIAAGYLATLLLAYNLKTKDKFTTAVGLSIIPTLLVLTLWNRATFHYLLWATPLLFLFFRQIRLLSVILLIQFSSFASYKLLANHLQAGLFAPINPDYFASVPTINSLVGKFFPYSILSGIGFFVFTFLNLFIIFKIFLYLFFQSPVKIKSG